MSKLKELVQERDIAKKEYDKICKTVRPYSEKYWKAVGTVKNEFIKQKLYIPIDKLPDYIGENEISEVTVVFENGETEDLSHPYDISYETTKWKNGNYVPARRLVSGCDDSGWSFEYDIDDDHVIGFYDLKLADNTEIKETYMEEIIRKVIE